MYGHACERRSLQLIAAASAEIQNNLPEPWKRTRPYGETRTRTRTFAVNAIGAPALAVTRTRTRNEMTASDAQRNTEQRRNAGLRFERRLHER